MAFKTRFLFGLTEIGFDFEILFPPSIPSFHPFLENAEMFLVGHEKCLFLLRGFPFPPKLHSYLSFPEERLGPEAPFIGQEPEPGSAYFPLHFGDRF